MPAMHSLRFVFVLSIVPASILACAAVFLIAAPAHAATYEVGPGHPYTSIGAVPWESIAAGDSVKIHHRAEDYHEKWVICRVGTAERPIVVQGIASPTGQLPVVNGIDATTRSQLNFWNENRGVIKIGGANNPPDTMPAYIVVENLDIRSARPPYTFTGRNGVTPYASNAAAIYIEKGEHIEIRGCTFRDCGNGFFCAAQTTDLLLERNTIFDNGIEGSIYEHNNYTESLGIVFQFNHFGPLRAGCPGNNLKDRSAGAIIRYNWIESGNRQLDLVDSDYDWIYGDPAYRSTFVYGNVLVEPDGAGNSQILHYGGDSGDTDRYRKGTLFLHNNTIVSTRTGNTTLARLSTDDETCDARNNVILVTAAGNRLAMLAESGGTIHLTRNWLKSGWVDSHGGGSGVVIDHGNVEGSDPGFRDLAGQDFELVDGSACVDAGSALGPPVTPDHLPVMEYIRHALGRPRPADGVLDIGAYEHAGASGTHDAAAAPAVALHPNPARDRVTIRARAGAPIRVVGVDGRVRRAFDPPWPAAPGPQVQLTWEMPADLPSGVYFVTIPGTGRGAPLLVIR